MPMRHICRHASNLTQSGRLHAIRGLTYPRVAARLIHDIAADARVGGSTKPGATSPSRLARNLNEYKNSFEFNRQSTPAELQVEGTRVTVNGFLSRRRVMHSKLVFADVETDPGLAYPSQPNGQGPRRQVQITSAYEQAGGPDELVNKDLRAVLLHSPVTVTGTVAKVTGTRIDIKLESIKPLNMFPKDIIVSEGTVFPPSSRHLQIRFSETLRTRLYMRNSASMAIEETLASKGFLQVETPLLFKSTPEGASEFLVPTRRAGMAYALPQSPQQYKQLLMASGVRGYYQFARCFRDEDLRADRQPEFTQLDMEMSFATARDVRDTVEQLIRSIFARLSKDIKFRLEGDKMVPVLPSMLASEPQSSSQVQETRGWVEPPSQEPFQCISYATAMAQYGCDKPDLRIPFTISRVDDILPRDFIQKISNLGNPAVEVIVLRPTRKSGSTPTMKDVQAFMDSLPSSLLDNPDGGPAPLLFNPSQPLGGLSALGFEAAEKIRSLEGVEELAEGDILIFQAREDKPFQGGSTALGRIRTALYEFAIGNKFLPLNNDFKFLWVNEFPMFTPDNDKDPGQGGTAGFSATHHPFTAPFSQADFDLLSVDPLAARGDSFDLVVNGVELGGGSRRIHLPQMQEDIMREVLKMSDERIAQFSHLIEALRAGCPPHAGFALGFDRLIAVLSYAESLRDVVAFPKSKKGEDLMVKSPARITNADLERYHLSFRGKKSTKEAA
ncbi:hypothetical protein GQ53DRAFT_741588 [Thozetella sp. PMI_491]|nr:hypothetical protein GQ53DRAFT_741588 [Thozetella sp. PMI_491]